MHHLPKQSILFPGSIQACLIHICWGCVHVGLGDKWSVLGNHCTYDRCYQARLPQRVGCGYSIRCREFGVHEWANLEVQVNSCYAYPRQAMQPSRIRALLHDLWRHVGTCLRSYWTMLRNHSTFDCNPDNNSSGSWPDGRLPQRVGCGYSIRCREFGVQEWANLEVQVNSCNAMQPSRIRALLHDLWRHVGTCLGSYWTMPDIISN